MIPTNPASSDDGDMPRSRRAPQFLPGSRQISLAALRERIEEEFIAETAARPDILLDASTEPTRRDLIREVADYVLAVEGLNISRADRLALLDMLYADLFSLGPLDSFLNDKTITELTIDGPDRVHLRRGAGDMTPADVHFDDGAHLERTVRRVLLTAGAELTERDPFVEVGTVLRGRPARLTVAAPPASPLLHVEVRLHPHERATMASCITSGLLDEEAAALLQRLLAAGHGLMIAGDVGTGKTTLLEALLPSLPLGSICVERSAELRVPEGIERLVALPPASDHAPVDFADQISAALDRRPAWLVIDEIRFDEARATWQALTTERGPRCLWVFRGAIDPVRLRAAFSMSVRRAQPGIEQEFIHAALLARLPFVALLARRSQRLSLLSLNKWQHDAQQPDTLTLHALWPGVADPLQGI
jgi:pilus assembly protein CpaF